MRVLVADDDPVYRSLLGDLLRQWQFEPVTVSNGRAALEMLQRPEGPRLAILDWMMPQMDGFEVARAIRADKATEDIYVLLITGSRNKEEVMKVLVCGADDYLIKPFQPIDLKLHLRTAMRIQHLQQELKELRALHEPQAASAR